ncbi:Hg(II)-responsive transcriptional regulator [Ferrovum sp.]|uniref:Hg(II)-responsive transcriptional regulator n=1 Tax=Ferrovum sp. TaxID=2609467 RepID=UPI00261EE27A|nr:Hg(II)-responsive transcriptional regulator [Ferrovum sp.]
MNNNIENLSIGIFAKAAGVNVETIRFYQRKGLLSEPDRPYGSIRRYGAADVARVKFVKSAQHLGFSLDEISQLLKLEDGTHCSEAAELATLRLADVRTRLADLKRIEAALSKLVGECHVHAGNISCPLIEALHEPVVTEPCTVPVSASPRYVPAPVRMSCGRPD